MSKKTEKRTMRTAFESITVIEREPERPRAMSETQRNVMKATCRLVAEQKTGYEKVPIEALRVDPGVHRLLDMLEYCRPGGSPDEDGYIVRYIKGVTTHEDDYGNLFATVTVPDGHPHILWSTHTDTVHRHGGKQRVEITDQIAWTSDGSCLGADDTVGNWLALEMIKAGVPGTYVFHREEESGGGGSMWLARNAPTWLGTFDCAIALDRAGYADVITYQGGERCCSEAFAKSLAGILGGAFKPCDTGVFTDTANYTGLIGECTNLSVGYFRQHGPTEHTSLAFAYRLRSALIAADWTKLQFERKPGEREPDMWAEWDRYAPRRPERAYGDVSDEQQAMEQFVENYPWHVAEFLIAMGYTTDDLELFDPEEERR